MELENKGMVLALGFFDGVHRGHMRLIEKTLEIARDKNLDSGVMTFKEHPLARIFPTYAPWLITTNDEKVALIKAAGIQNVYLDDFSDELMQLSPEAFIREYLLVKYPVKHIVVGFNYTFAFQGAGTTADLMELGKRYGFGVSVVPPFIIEETAVSSTVIRELISVGEVAAVPKFLGRHYSISGIVVEGKKLGRTFNIPTANLKMAEKRILPSSGVYFTQVQVRGKIYDGLTNLGFNPTFEKHPYSIETYIYDFAGDIYGEPLALEFMEKQRDEIKFAKIEDLIAQIKGDIIRIDEKYRKGKRS